MNNYEKIGMQEADKLSEQRNKNQSKYMTDEEIAKKIKEMNEKLKDPKSKK